MNPKLLIYLVSAILLVNIIFAEDRHYELRLSYDYINDKVELKHIYVIGGKAPDIVELGDYRYELRSFNEKIITTFKFQMSANNNQVTIKAPYYKDGKTINIYDKSNKKLLDVDVGYFADVCGDKECQDHENYGRCSEDCPSGSKDNYCDKLSDGKCDPDCLAGDYDCETKRLSTLFVSIGIGLFVIIMILLFLRFLPKRKKYENILQLKHYIITNLRRGYTKQQIAAELKRDGWPEGLITHSFKSIKPEHTSKEELLELHNYIINTEKIGYTDEQIKKELLKEGWSKEAVDLAFKTIEKPETAPKQEILQLHDYIVNALSRGYTKEQIMFILKKEGWPEELLNRIFDRLKYSIFAKKK